MHVHLGYSVPEQKMYRTLAKMEIISIQNVLVYVLVKR